MVRRVSVAAVAIPAALGLVYLGGWPLALLLALFGVVGAFEFYRMAEQGGLRPVRIAGFVGAAGMPLAALLTVSVWRPVDAGWLALGAAIWFVVTVSVTALRRTPDDRPLSSVAVTVFGALYAGALPAFLLPIRHAGAIDGADAATALVFMPLVVTWVCDSLAMSAGSAIGGPKLARVLSPNKTWAGAIAGSMGAVLLAPLYGTFVLGRFDIEIALWQLAAFGLIISIVGQIGDLSESLFKREVGAKDSGGFFPGHGGVLDRFDSLYWVLPSSALLLKLYGTI
ncbi:MAG: phosphatidate cytidylyltransferase [Gemmatimonadales bacterium]